MDRDSRVRWRRGEVGLEAGGRSWRSLDLRLVVFQSKMAAKNKDYISQHSLQRGLVT